MFVKVLTLIVLVSVLNHVMGDWFGSRTDVRETKTQKFECSCEVICHPEATCEFNCMSSCGGRKRRASKDGFVLLLPCKFETWDLNKDGKIEIDEFFFHTRIAMDDVNGNLFFDKSDKNDDGKLSPEEFKAAPLRKEKC